ncbi:hypothetical protein JHK86_016407 [Glycine max]|nr:hypothetical protein JHK86_016407 [Glycine max]
MQFQSLLRHAFVWWWNQFDTTKAEPDKVKIWFEAHPELRKTIDPETSMFLNQKSKLATFLAGSSSSSSTSDPRNLNLLIEQDNQTHEVTPKHNLFDEEVRFKEINQNMDDWSIPEISQDTLYVHEYKVMNTCASTVLLKPQKGETTLYITNMTKANVSIPRTIKWDEVTLPEKWVMDKATPSIPRPTPTIEQFKQDNSGKVEITFNRRNSFSSRIEASRQSEYKSTRRPFSVKTRSIPVGLSRSESQPVSRINLQGLDTTSRILRTTYN